MKNFKSIIAIALVLFMTVSSVPFITYATAEEIDTPVTTDGTSQSVTGSAIQVVDESSSVVSGSAITVVPNTEESAITTVTGSALTVAKDILVEQTLEVFDSTVKISISGNLPEGVSVTATKVSLPDDQVAGRVVFAYDITIYKADGTIYEPEESVAVTFSLLEDKEGKTFDIVHIADTGEVETVATDVIVENGELTFGANEFSVYAVVTTAYQVINKTVNGLTVYALDTDLKYEWHDNNTDTNGTQRVVKIYKNSSSDLVYLEVTESSAISIGGGMYQYGLHEVSTYYGLPEGAYNVIMYGDTVTNIDASKNPSVFNTITNEMIEYLNCTEYYLYLDSNNATFSNSSVHLDNESFGPNITKLGNIFNGTTIGNIIDFTETSVIALGSRTFESSQIRSVIMSNDMYFDYNGDPYEEKYYGDGVTAYHLINTFNNCTNLESITLPKGISLPSWAFIGCTNLITIIGLNEVKSIGQHTFANCSNLNMIDLSGSTTLITIGQYAFSGCDSLSAIDVSGNTSLTTIGAYAFSQCRNLTSVNLSGCTNLSSIGENIFAWDYSMSSINLSGCTSLQAFANGQFSYTSGTLDLSGCTNLEDISGMFYSTSYLWYSSPNERGNADYHSKSSNISGTVYDLDIVSDAYTLLKNVNSLIGWKEWDLRIKVGSMTGTINAKDYSTWSSLQSTLDSLATYYGYYYSYEFVHCVKLTKISTIIRTGTKLPKYTLTINYGYENAYGDFVQFDTSIVESYINSVYVGDKYSVTSPDLSGRNYSLKDLVNTVVSSTMLSTDKTINVVYIATTITPQYTVVLPATIALTINEDDANKMIASVPYSINYILPDAASIEISIPDTFSLTNEAGDTLKVSTNKHSSTWDNSTSGVTEAIDGTFTGNDIFTLSAPTEAGLWTGTLRVIIDVTE